MMTRFIRNRRGQVAIFIALLFQVLFLFFAMIVNVGLLVHHKINLQNSVDIAAYYGAMKQAEVLNAISHVNYQIRQSWKLLVWRHRVLGSAGADTNFAILPLEKLANGAVNEVPAANSDNDTNQYGRLYRLPRFCIAYSPHEVTGAPASGSGGSTTNTAENSCKKSYEIQSNITLPNPNLLRIANFNAFGTVVANAITQAIEQTTNRCAAVGSLNFVIGARFIIGHIIDSQERAHTINYLATGISAESDNFFDLDGESGREGVRQTLMKNLTDANRDTVEFQMINGLGVGDCQKTGSTQVGSEEGGDTPPWLVPVQVYPVLRYVDCVQSTAGGGAAISQTAKVLDATTVDNLPSSRSIAPPVLRDQVQSIYDNGVLTARPILTGFEKSPWCVAYVGVKATSKPKIPFMPLSEVTLSAEGYAKPFGGRIGPWYVNTWPRDQHGNSRITGTEGIGGRENRLESNGPTRVINVGGVTDPDDPSWVPNVARMVGDGKVVPLGGFAIERVLAYFHRAIRADLAGSSYGNLLSAGASYPFPVNNDPRPSLSYYDSIGASFSTPMGSGLDQLSWSKDSNAAPKLRLLEIAAIAPNLFDLAYYSIDPDFYNNYYKRIDASRRSQSRSGSWRSSRFLLGDHGARFDTIEKAKQMNIFDQIRIQRDLAPDNALNSSAVMPYAIKNSEHLLNSWAVDTLLDYRTNTKKFGKCLSQPGSTFETLLGVPTPGNCVDGGRVGFSVKLISKDYLKAEDLPLGGASTSGGIRNRLPTDWE